MFVHVKRIFKWARCLQYLERRKQSDYRATNRACRMVINRELAQHRAVQTRTSTASI